MLRVLLRQKFLAGRKLRNYSSARVKEILRRYDDLKRDEHLASDASSSAANLADATQLQKAVDASVFSGVESAAATIFLKMNSERFESVERKKQELFTEFRTQLQHKESREGRTLQEIHRPLSADDSLKFIGGSLASDKTSHEEEGTTAAPADPWGEDEDISKVAGERGFFVHGKGFREEYSAATVDDLPETEMNDPEYDVYNFNEKESVENIAFQNPGQNPPATKKMKRIIRAAATELVEEGGAAASGEILSSYDGEGDVTVAPMADAHCSGCGANFHCNQNSLPGFVPLRLFKEIERNQRRLPDRQRSDYLCRRCFLYKEYKFLLNVNVCEVDYRAVMGHLKLVQEALILLVVDMTDIECSIHRDLPNIIGTGKPMIVIGNKIDLLPPDAQRGYLKRYYDALRRAVSNAGFANDFNILKYSLISAKTGFGVEDLITNIYMKWISARGLLRSNIYVVGCTNAGKSTLFNTFLQSDLCKIRAIDLVERVTTSPWPGTTLSLLKFPVWNPTPRKLEMRRRRLLANQQWNSKERQLSSDLYRSTNDPNYITLQGFVGNTFKEAAEEETPQNALLTQKEFMGEVDTHPPSQESEVERKRHFNANNNMFATGNWCYDTPGTVNKEQVLDLFTLEELINVIPRSMIIPRTFIIYAGESLLVGGVGRIDILAAKKYNGHDVSLFATVFSSDRLPINHMSTQIVDDFMEKYRGSKLLGAPLGDENRLERFSKMKYQKFSIKNTADDRKVDAFADVVLSSVGWVTFTSQAAEGVYLRAWTPEARGVFVRQPLVMNASVLRGDRIPGTNGYETMLPAEVEQSIYNRSGRLNPPQLVAVSGEPMSSDDVSEEFSFGRVPQNTTCFDLA